MNSEREKVILAALHAKYPTQMGKLLNMEDGIEGLVPHNVKEGLHLNGINNFVEVHEQNTRLSVARAVTASCWVRPIPQPAGKPPRPLKPGRGLTA